MATELSKKQKKLMRLLRNGKKVEAVRILETFSPQELNFKEDTGETPLFLATNKGFVGVVRKMVEKGADVTERDSLGRTPLMMAVSLGYEKTSRILRHKEKEIGEKSTTDKKGLNLLMQAACSGKESMVSYYLAKEDVNAKSKEGDTALILAAGKEKGIGALKTLLSHKKIDVDAQNDGGWTALHTAISSGHTKAALLLLKNGARFDIKNKFKNTALDMAVEENNGVVFKRMLRLSKKDNSFAAEKYVKKALVEGKKNIIDVLIKEKQIDLKDKAGVQKLVAMALDGHEAKETLMHLEKRGLKRSDIMLACLKEGTQKEKINQNAIQMLKSMASSEEINKVVINLLADKDFNFKNVKEALFQEGGDALVMAVAKSGNIKALRFLKETGINLSVQDEKGHTPLIKAVLKGDYKMAKALINMGADLNQKDAKGNSALMYALSRMPKNKKGLAHAMEVEQKRRFVALSLIEKGADVNATNKEGVSVLMYAASIGYYDVFDAAIKKGADVNAVDKKGNPVLAYTGSSAVDTEIERLNKEAIARKIDVLTGVDLNTRLARAGFKTTEENKTSTQQKRVPIANRLIQKNRR